MFANRTEAGRKLAEKLDQYLSSHPDFDRKTDLLVVGLPRGGVPVALEVARRFGCQLDILVAKKLPFPGQPEYAIGAVSSDGVVVLSHDIPDSWQWRAYIEQQRQSLLKATTSIEREFYERSGQKRASFENKTVIVVDDGIATGMTALAALQSIRQRGARCTILATPVISSDTYEQLRSSCDVVIALSVPTEFRSVGLHYANFEQTSNDEVVHALQQGAQLVRHSESQSPRVQNLN